MEYKNIRISGINWQLSLPNSTIYLLVRLVQQMNFIKMWVLRILNHSILIYAL